MKTTTAASFLVAASLVLPLCAQAASEGSADRSSPKAFVNDSVITTKIKAELAEEKMSSLVKIRVDTDKKGMVVLRGRANSKEAVDKAESIARGVEGVKGVDNRIKVVADK